MAKPRKKVIRRSPPAREYSVVIERDREGWYVASVAQLPGCHTQARSLDGLMERVREAIALYPAAAAGASPEFIGVQRIAV